jgi:hypothetical protein
MKSGLEWPGVAAIALGGILMIALGIELSRLSAPFYSHCQVGGCLR